MAGLVAFVVGISHLLPPAETVVWVRAHEALSVSAETKREKLGSGEGGVNLTERRTYAGPPPLIGFAKPQTFGESILATDPDSGILTRVIKSWDPDKKAMAVRSEPFTASTIQGQEVIKMQGQIIKNLQNDWPSIRERMAQAYGIKPEDIQMDGRQFALRKSIEIGTTGVREAAVSRIDKLLGLNTVPLTVLRAERERRPRTDGSDDLPTEAGPDSQVMDLTSVQQEIPGKSVHRMKYDEYEQALQNPEKRKSLIRIAILDYLVKSHDRHNNNIFFDGQQFHAIDNGLSFGLSQEKNTAAGKQTESLDPYVSAPMLEMQKHDDWQLDPEALSALRQVHDDIVDYLHQPKDDPQAENSKGGKTFAYLHDLFGTMFSHKQIATKEFKLFLGRLRNVLQNGGRFPGLDSDKLKGNTKQKPRQQAEA